MAQALNGSTDFFTAPAPFHGASALTVSVRPNITSLGSENKIAGVWQEGGSGFEWLLTTSGTSLLGAIFDGSGFHIISGGTIPAGSFCSVILRYTGSIMEIFLDGVSVANESFSASTATTSALMSIGCGLNANSSPNAPLAGSFAETALWNTGISTADVVAISKGFCPLMIEPSNLKFYSPMIVVPVDLIGGVTVTPHGSPTPTTHPMVYRR